MVAPFKNLGLRTDLPSGCLVPFFTKVWLGTAGGGPKDLDLVLNATFTLLIEPDERLTAPSLFQHFDSGLQSYNKTAPKTTLSLPVTQLLRNLREILFSTPAENLKQDNGSQSCMGFLSNLELSGTTVQLSDLPHVFLQPGQLIVDSNQPY